MEKFLIEIKSVPTEEESKALYESLKWLGVIHMLYTGTKAYIYGELESGSIDYLEEKLVDKGYDFDTDRG